MEYPQTNTPTPPFWLDIRKEFIVTAFDELLVYLKLYNYNTKQPDSNFSKTFQSLKGLVYDIFDVTVNDNLGEIHTYNELSNETMIRIIACYLLTCHSLRQQDLLCLNKLASRILLTISEPVERTIEQLEHLQYNCIYNCNVVRYGFDWSSLEKTRFSLSTFAFLLGNTQFTPIPATDTVKRYYENKGLLVTDYNQLRIVTMNLENYLSEPTQCLFGDKRTKFFVLKREKPRCASFDDLVALNASIKTAQTNVLPSGEKHLLTYDFENHRDDVTVRVTSIRNNRIEAETIDPHYEPIEGNVYVRNYCQSVSFERLIGWLRPGDYINVKLQKDPRAPFLFHPSFEYFCKTVSMQSRAPLQAVYISHYSFGTRWVTENGLQISILNEHNTPEVLDAIDYGTVMYVRPFESKFDAVGNFVINGEFCEEHPPLPDDDYFDKDAFLDDATDAILQEYLAYSTPDYTPLRKPEEVAIDVNYVLPLAYTYYQYAKTCSTSTIKRYEMLMIARFIARLCNATFDAALLSYEMEYITALVRFAQGKTASSLALPLDSVLANNAKANFQHKLIDTLSAYTDNPLGSHYTQRAVLPNDIFCEVRNLVTASNILLNKISNHEINRIKRSITSLLQVEDMFVINRNAATYYGEENETLEFKTSVVYPPSINTNITFAQAKPTEQKWNILKAVCGFLNSTNGGEILLGVNDNGFAVGLQSDLQYLVANKKIHDASMDKYILYVRSLIDGSFTDDSRITAAPYEVTATRVTYSPIVNQEGIEILRIRIEPFEYGIVEFFDVSAMPTGFYKSYTRSGNSTIPLAAESKRLLLSKKLATKHDATTQKMILLQEAKQEKKLVLLKDYIHDEGKVDRRIEVHRILPLRKAFIGYDIDSRTVEVYRLIRANEIVATTEGWKNKTYRFENLNVDLFNAVEGLEPPIRILFKLAPAAYNALIEQHPLTRSAIKDNIASDSDQFPWIFDTQVYNLIGVAQFYVAFAHFIKVEEAEGMMDFVQQYIRDL